MNKMVQLTILTIDEYGPWTHTLGNDREHKLQMYQASLYETIQNMFSVKGGLAFSNRFDEFFIITDGIGYYDHIEIETKLKEMYPFKISMSIANSKYPFVANRRAHLTKLKTGYDKPVVASFNKENSNEKVHLIHLDIEGITKIRQTSTPYDISLLIQATHHVISVYCYENQLLGFFMGGDNFVIISDENTKEHSEEIAKRIKQNIHVDVNCGIGEEYTARIAMAMATKNLDEIRRIREISKRYPRILDNDIRLSEYSKISH